MSKGNMSPTGAQRPRRFRTWLKRSAITIAVLLVVILVPLAYILYPTLKSYPQAPVEAAASQREGNLQDLAQLRHLPDFDRSFSPESRAAFAQALTAMEQSAGSLDRAALAMGAAKAVALADNGHTNVVGLAGGQSFNAVPIRLGWFADGLFVVAAAEDQDRLLAARVLGANGKTTDALVEALRPYVGGPANLAREFAPNFLISPELLHAAGLAETAESSRYDLRLADGSPLSVTLDARAGTPGPHKGNIWPARDLSPVARAGQSQEWRHVLDGAALPAYLAQPDRNYWHSYPEANLLYVQINRVRDQPPTLLSQYLSDVLDEAKNKPIRNAVVDLRFNNGGNYLLSADFSQRLPDILPTNGRLFILTAGNTFSAGITTAAWLKFYGGARVTIIGQSAGDRMQFWGEGGTTVLPHSKLAVRYSTGFHDWENGCSLSQLRTCFLLNYIYGVPAGRLEPDIGAQPTFSEYIAGNDRAMSVVRDQLAAVGPSG